MKRLRWVAIAGSALAIAVVGVQFTASRDRSAGPTPESDSQASADHAAVLRVADRLAKNSATFFDFRRALEQDQEITDKQQKQEVLQQFLQTNWKTRPLMASPKNSNFLAIAMEEGQDDNANIPEAVLFMTDEQEANPVMRVVDSRSCRNEYQRWTCDEFRKVLASRGDAPLAKEMTSSSLEYTEMANYLVSFLNPAKVETYENARSFMAIETADAPYGCFTIFVYGKKGPYLIELKNTICGRGDEIALKGKSFATLDEHLHSECDKWGFRNWEAVARCYLQDKVDLAKAKAVGALEAEKLMREFALK